MFFLLTDKWVWAERAFLGSAKTAFKFKYEIKVVQLHKVERKEGA